MIKNYIPSYRNSLEYQIEAVSYAMSIEFGDTLKEGTVINHSNRKYILDSIEYSYVSCFN